MTPLSKTAGELASLIGAEVIGDAAKRIASVSSIRSANAESLVFAEEEGEFRLALKSKSQVIIAGEFARAMAGTKSILIVKQPKLTFARISKIFHPHSVNPGIHPQASVASSAQLGCGVRIEAGAVVSANALLGERSAVGANSYVGEGVRIGSECIIAPNVTIYSKTTMGDRVKVQAGAVLGSEGFGYVRDAGSGEYIQFPQIGELRIEDDVEIGANTTIDRGALDATIIGRGTKLDNLVHVGHNVTIGKNVVIAAQTGISGSVIIKDGAVIGGQVGMGDHVTIEAGVVVGSRAGILPGKTLRGKGEVFWGVPARPLKQYLKELAILARLAKSQASGGKGNTENS